MSSITPSPQQAAAIADIVDWYRHRRGQQQVFRLFGYAGTGKSTITAAAIEALGLRPMTRDASFAGGVLFAAFTGKAALVMTRKGTPATTIHSLIYRVSEATPEEIARVEKELFDLQRDLRRMGVAERAFVETQISKLQLRLADIHKPSFLLNEQSLARDASLIVLDEVSMVGREMAADLLAFGKPILVLGDPGQLPPIEGAGAFTDATPDVMLTEIHRQAGESAIIRLATLARQGHDIPAGEHDAHVWKLPRNAVRPEQMLRGGQVICGRNDTRRWLNSQMKAVAGFPAPYPAGGAEKLICLKNRHDLGLVNGMFLSLAEIQHEGACAQARARCVARHRLHPGARTADARDGGRALPARARLARARGRGAALSSRPRELRDQGRLSSDGRSGPQPRGRGGGGTCSRSRARRRSTSTATSTAPRGRRSPPGPCRAWMASRSA